MFDLRLHSTSVAALLKEEQGDQIPRLLERLAANLPLPEGQPPSLSAPPERLAATASGLEPVVSLARAFLNEAAKAPKGEAARSPLFFELAAALEGVRDATRAMAGSCRGAVLAMARSQSAAARKGDDEKAKARDQRIQQIWKDFDRAAQAAASDAEDFQAFFLGAGRLLDLAAETEIKAAAVAPAVAQINQFIRGERSALQLEANLDARRILARAGTALPDAKARRQPHLPLEAKIHEAVDAALPERSTPPLRAFLSELTLSGHILERQAALARELREKEEELEFARKKYRAVSARHRKDALFRILTLGAHKSESFGGPKTLKLALDAMEEDAAFLRSESEMSANSPAAYIKAAAACLTALLALARREGARTARRLADKEAASAFMAAMDRILGPKGACPPDVPGFWAPALAVLAVCVAASRCDKAFFALNARNEAMFHGCLPPMQWTIQRGAAVAALRAATPEGGETVFQKSLDDLLKNLDISRQTRFHSRKEQELAERLFRKFSGVAALLQAEPASLSPERLVKRQALAKRLPAIKMELARGLDSLLGLHRAEMRRISPAAILELSETFFPALKDKYGSQESVRVDRARETMQFARTLAVALPGMNADPDPEIVLGEEILLGMENVLTDPGLDLDATQTELAALFDTARSILMNMEPAKLKQLVKKEPNISRALNFLASDPKRGNGSTKGKK